MQVGLRDLDVIPEDPIEPHFEGADPRACALAVLHLGDDLSTRPADRAQLVELGVDPIAGETPSRAMAGGSSRRFGHMRSRRSQVSTRRARCRATGPVPQPEELDRRTARSEWLKETRSRARQFRGRSVPRVVSRSWIPARQSRNLPRSVERNATLHRIESVTNPFQGRGDGGATMRMETSAHRRHRPIHLAQKRALGSPFASNHDIEMPQT